MVQVVTSKARLQQSRCGDVVLPLSQSRLSHLVQVGTAIRGTTNESSRAMSDIQLQFSMPRQHDTQPTLLLCNDMDDHTNAHHHTGTLSLVRWAKKRFSGKRESI